MGYAYNVVISLHSIQYPLKLWYTRVNFIKDTQVSSTTAHYHNFVSDHYCEISSSLALDYEINKFCGVPISIVMDTENHLFTYQQNSVHVYYKII